MLCKNRNFRTSVQSAQNNLRNPAIENSFASKVDPILATSPGTTTHRRMSVRFEMNGEVLFAGRIVTNNYESTQTFIESSRSSAGINKLVWGIPNLNFIWKTLWSQFKQHHHFKVLFIILLNRTHTKEKTGKSYLFRQVFARRENVKMLPLNDFLFHKTKPQIVAHYF